MKDGDRVKDDKVNGDRYNRGNEETKEGSLPGLQSKAEDKDLND